MNKLTKYIIPVLSLVSLTSCTFSFESYVGCVKTTTDSSLDVKYIKFNGTSEYTINVSESRHTLNLKVELTTTSGDVSYVISLPDRTSLYTYSTTENYSTYNVLPSFGKYIIQVKGNNHKGSYRFSWSKSNS